jgi:hypothetical protein
MGKVIAAITTSVDGYIVGPQDGPEHGLGIEGSRSPPRRSCWAAGSGCSRDSSRTSTSTCSALGVRSTPPTCGTPSGGPGRSTARTDGRTVVHDATLKEDA